jgi:hypothetical protein
MARVAVHWRGGSASESMGEEMIGGGLAAWEPSGNEVMRQRGRGASAMEMVGDVMNSAGCKGSAAMEMWRFGRSGLHRVGGNGRGND